MVRATQQTNGSYNIYIRGCNAGYTNLVIKTKDEVGLVKKVPIGVFDNVKITNLTGKTDYGKITLSFDGLEDESNIDGYVIRRIQGYRDVEHVYIEKKELQIIHTNIIQG